MMNVISSACRYKGHHHHHCTLFVSNMAGPVHETAAEVQTITTKRSAEADPEPSPVAKRPTEVPQQKEQESQPAQDTAIVNVGYFSPYKHRPKMTLCVDENQLDFPQALPHVILTLVETRT